MIPDTGIRKYYDTIDATGGYPDQPGIPKQEIPADFKKEIGIAKLAYKERCKVDRDNGHLSDFDFGNGAEWAYRHLHSQPPSPVGEARDFKHQPITAHTADDAKYITDRLYGLIAEMSNDLNMTEKTICHLIKINLK
jgi:hypothetical protein